MNIKHSLILFFLTLIARSGIAQIVFPDDAVINVLNYRGDISESDFTSGTVDVSDAILAAIADNVEAKIAEHGENHLVESYVLYFPAGTYLISKPIEVDSYSNNADSNGNLGQGGTGKVINYQGAGKDFTTIKLADGAPLFSDKNNPIPVFSNTEADPVVFAWNHIAFMSSIWNLTVDVGNGNPGAIGISYIANNQGSIRDVNVVGNGSHTGIDMYEQSIPGPALIKNVSIDGFETGIRIKDENYSMTLEDVLIKNAKVGIVNNNHPLNVRKLTTQNITETAIRNMGSENTGFLTLLDSELGGSGTNAIESNTFLFARNITQSGFINILKDDVKSTVISESSIEEYVSHEIFSLADGAGQKSINLPIEETPEVDWSTSAENWVSVLDYGYQLGSDSGFIESVQAAIDDMNKEGNEAKNVLYFPIGDYRITSKGTINIYGNVKKIMGNLASLRVNLDKSHDLDPMFNIQDTDYPTLFIERMNLEPRPWKKKHAVFRNESSRDVVLRHIYIGHGKAYENRGATGKLFMEDVAALSQIYWAVLDPNGQSVPYEEALPQFDFGNQKVWIRQFDPEQKYTHAESDGGQLWILGMKTEEPGTIVHAKNGARVEVLGGCVLPAFPDEGEPMFILEDSQGSFVIPDHVFGGKFDNGSYYVNWVEETRGNVTRVLTRNDLPERFTLGRAIPLFVGYGGEMVEIRSINVSKSEIAFGEVEIVEDKTSSFTIENDGNTSINVSSIEIPDGYTIDWDKGLIETGESQVVNITFAPKEIKEYSGNIIITSDAEITSNSIALIGTGIEEIIRSLSIPNELNFGEVPMGESKTLSLTLANSGNQTVNISGITMGSRFTATKTSFGIAPNAEETINITFAPINEIDYSMTFRISSDITVGKNSFIVRALGIEKSILSVGDEHSMLNIFPNPTSGSFQIRGATAKLGRDIQIYDQVGRMIMASTLDENFTVNINPSVKSGIYILTLTLEGKQERMKILIR